MARIKIIDYDVSAGRLREIYDEIIRKRGKLADVHKIQSLNPESIVRHMDFYMAVMFGQSPLSRAQREMMAVVVSAANQCAYCVRHHSEALNFYWKDDRRIQQLEHDFRILDLTPRDTGLCQYVHDLTVSPATSKNEKNITFLKRVDFTDREILDATLVAAYFNFVNRMVLALGVEVEADNGQGYNH